MSAARTERLLNLLTLLLNSRRPISLREIRDMEEFHAYSTDDPKSGERAFERDKAALLELGVPLRWVAPDQDEDDDGVGGYLIDRERYFLPDLALTPTEHALLSIAGAAAAALEGFAGKEALVRALAKLGFDARDTSGAPSLAHAPLQEGVDARQVGEFLSLLQEAVARRRRVRLVYAASGAAEERRVDPYGLYYRQGAWYLVGYCYLRAAERTFHVGRIRSLEYVGVAGLYDVPEAFDLQQHAGRRPWEFGEGPATLVTVRLAERLRSAVGEIFGPRAQLEETAAGLHVHLQVTNLEALGAAVLPYGAAAQVLQPASLRQRLGAVYAALAERYRALPIAKVA